MRKLSGEEAFFIGGQEEEMLTSIKSESKQASEREIA